MRRVFGLITAFLFLALSFPSSVYGGEMEHYTMPKKDGVQGDKVVSDPLIFYDMGGSDKKTVTSYAGYTRFVASSPGSEIRITFDKFELTGSAAVYVYDGNIDFTNYNSPIPDGYLSKLTGSSSGESFQSSTGSLSVLYYSKSYSDGGFGWEATVEEFVPATMTWKDIRMEPVAVSTRRGCDGTPLAGINLTTEGSLNALKCTELSFSLGGSVTLSDVRNLRVVYSKGSNTPGGVLFGSPVDTSDGTLTFSGDISLRGGNNYFWLLGDISEDAVPGAEIKTTVTGGKVSDTQVVPSPLSPESGVKIINEVWLKGTPSVYTVNGESINFYDDGGPDGTISLNYDGYATFKPGNAGKVVRISFSSVDLFNTSSIGKNDKLNVYSGSGIDETLLLGTLQSGTIPVSITSMSPDGSLTVSLTSLTGVNPKGGFAAVVEEIYPEDMSISTVKLSHPVKDSVSADDKDVKVLLINIVASGTKNPVEISTLSLADESTAKINRGTVAWLGKNPEGKGVVVGEYNNPHGDYTITLSSVQRLTEGDNYLLVSYDVSETAVNSETVDCGLKGINADYAVAEGSPEGNRVIENVCYSDDSTVVKTIYGGWKFRNKKSSYSSYSYEATKGNQVTTFIPGHSDKVIEIEFSKFKLRTSSYQQAPVFKVYDGKDINSPVLWEAKTGTDYSNGPQRKLRPTNADGALTVLFNTTIDATSGYGFEADVREYASVPMRFVKGNVIQQNNGGNVRPSSKDFAVLGIETTMEGDKNPLCFDGVTVDLKDCSSVVSAVKVYGGIDSAFTTTTLLASGEVTGKTVTLTPNVSYAMPENVSYLWIALDMKDSFASDIKVDASVKELKLGGNVVALENPDPEGYAITKNIVYFEGGGKEVRVDGSLLFYDDGGPTGKYTTSHSGTMTFVPGKEGEVIRMTVQEFYTNYQDHLYIYEGRSSDTESRLLSDLSSSKTASDLLPIISKSEDGAITVKFDPKKNNINNGWSILVESFVPQPMRVSGVEVSAVNDTKMLRGSANNKMLRLAVNVTGEKGSADITDFTFSSLESDTSSITGAKLWYTGRNAEFDLSNQYGKTVTTSPFTIEGDLSIDMAGTYYFWYTYDISSESVTDSKVQAEFKSLTSGGDVVAGPDDKKVLVTVQDGVHGTYSVGTSGDHDFRTISEAVESMKDGIDGAVIFELESGNYNELVSIPEIVGSSPLNTVTIRSKSGNREDVIINYNNYRDPGSSNYDKRYGVLTLDGVDYFNLENVTVSTTDGSFPGVVFFRNKSEHVTLDNCEFIMPKSTDAAKGSYLVYMYVKSGDINRNHNYTTVKNCKFDGGYIGMGLTGTSFVAHPKQHGGVITGNVFRNQGSKAIYLANEEDAVISNNDILIEGELTSSPYGMDLSESGGDLSVYGNVIRFKESSGRYTPNPMGIYLRIYTIGNVKSGNRRIFNNEINMTGCPGSGSAGIRVNNDIPGVEIVNNTLRLSASNPEGERLNGIYLAGTIEGGKIVNNIIQLETPGHAIYSQRKPYLNGAELSHNVCYTSGDKFGYIGGDPNGTLPEGFTQGSLTFEEFCQWAPMTSSYNEKTEFLSENVLEPFTSGSLVNGNVIDYVTTDLYGANRGSVPTIGAYEYASSTVAPEMAEGYPVFKDVSHESANYIVKSSQTGVLHYIVCEDGAQAPEDEAVKTSGLTAELRKGVETSVELSSLRPGTTYRVYSLISSLRGLDSEVMLSEPFETTYEPTRVATFEEAVVKDGRIEDGTMSFTGFEVVDIEDGVDPQPNAKAAKSEDGYAIIQLTNAPDLGLEGMFILNDDVVTLTSKGNDLKEIKSKSVEISSSWRYVDLRDMGSFTYLEIETDGEVSVDNVGGTPLALSVEIDRDETLRIPSGEEYTLNAKVTGGVSPYSYVWKNSAEAELSTSSQYVFTPKVSGTYHLEVTDARGAVTSVSTKVRVLGDLGIATFDDLYLSEESHWCGDVNDEDYTSGSFISGSFEFNNSYMSDWNSWAFFGYSNHTSTSFSNYMNDQWNSAVGHGVDDSSNYGIVFVSNFMGKTRSIVTNREEGDVIPGMYVTNSAWVVNAIEHGDGMSEGAFGHGDNLMLKLKGIGADGVERTLDIPLADYTSEDESEHWYLDTWQWVDLSGLGQVVSVEWDMSSTKNNSYGMTTPAYVCVDNLGAECPVKEVPQVNLSVNDEVPTDSFDVSRYFTFVPNEGRVSYSVDADIEGLTLDGDNLVYSGPADREMTVLVSALQRGRREWVKIPVKVALRPSGVESVEMTDVKMYPNPADSYINVSAGSDLYSIQIISMDGRNVMSIDDINGEYVVDVNGLSEGAYIVRFVTLDNRTAVRRLIIRR